MKKKGLALVTGGALRLGREISLCLAEQNYDIAIHYHNSEESALETKKEIEKLGLCCEIFKENFLKLEDTYSWLSKINNAFETNLDILVNSASAYQAVNITKSSFELFNENFTLNLKIPFFLTQAFAKLTKNIRAKKKHTEKRAQVINILDNKIFYKQFQYAIYVLSKKSLAEFTELAALEYASVLRVNGIAPGVFFPKKERSHSYLEWRKEGIPLESFGKREHLCMALDYLSKNSFVTGQTLVLDGGESIFHDGRNTENFFLAAKE